MNRGTETPNLKAAYTTATFRWQLGNLDVQADAFAGAKAASKRELTCVQLSWMWSGG